jgi:hypothetical protein
MYDQTTPPSAMPGFKGMFRPLGERTWRKLCDDPDYSSCWSALLSRVHQSGDLFVLETDRLPDDKASRAGPRPWELAKV